MENNNELALIEPGELSLVENNSLNAHQLAQLLKKTPERYVKERPAKGGGKWKYVTGGYIKKCLNLMFGWDWDFEIQDEKVFPKQIVVRGKLTCRSNGRTIIKTQYGRKDIAFRRESEEYLDIGNDFKAAASDCLKKCAAEIGIAADIYNADEFREVNVDTENEVTAFDLLVLFDLKKEALNETEIEFCKRIIEGNETTSFHKLQNFLNSK